MSFNIWEGIYSRFDECPKQGDGFESDIWAKHQLQRIKKLKVEIVRLGEDSLTYQNSLLPVITALIGSASKNKIKILDFGGGLGNTYLLTNCGCLRNIDFEFYITESHKVCETAGEIFKNDTRIHFYSTLPQTGETFDIIHLGSSLQYIEDWKSLLNDFAKYSARYILLADVPAGDIQTFATVQNYYESKIPYWFFNLNEIVGQMDSAGYELLLNSVFSDKRLGEMQPLPQNNFPKEYRIGQSRNLLFGRKKK